MNRNFIFILITFTFATCVGIQSEPEQLKNNVQLCFQDTTTIGPEVYLRVHKKNGILNTTMEEFLNSASQYLDSSHYQSQEFTTSIYLVKSCKPFGVLGLYDNFHLVFEEMFLSFDFDLKTNCDGKPCLKDITCRVRGKPYVLSGYDKNYIIDLESIKDKTLKEFILDEFLEENFELRNITYKDLHG